jgi:pre-mRNA 3'-end-processing factor FIP1
VSYESIQASNGVVAHLEEEAEKAVSSKATSEERQEAEEEEEDEGFEDDDSEDDDDIEIIMEPVARSLDFRSQTRQPPSRPPQPAIPQAPKAAQPSLTTEYTPIQRGGPPQTSVTLLQIPQVAEAVPGIPLKPTQPQQQTQQQQKQEQEPESFPDDGVDPNTLPVVTAPPSHPVVDPSATAIIDGRSILEVDINALADKPWRRPGSDISDWFNYGFDELSWEAYCYRRRDLGEMATVLKTNVINFSAMPEDQLVALPPEVRTMVMTGANAMMNNAANPNMMGANVMMDMGMMGPMGMGMNGDMGMGNPMMQGMMGGGPDGAQGQQPGVVANNGTPEQVMMQEGFNPNAGGMMNMGMPGGEYGIPDQNQMGQQIYPPVVEQPQSMPSVPNVPSGRGGSTPAAPFRGGRGAPGLGARGRGFPQRGRGRGGIYGGDAPPPAPVRPASPLPPGVPTGPRNQNKYKDRDGNAPAVDGLDYGGGKDAMARRTPSEQPEERVPRKRRSSPGLDDIRSSKRR